MTRLLPRSSSTRLGAILSAMAYDHGLADRVRIVVQNEPDLAEKRMFGGLAFLVGGRLAASVSSKGGLLLRVGPGQAGCLLDEPHVRRFTMRGRDMDGWLHVYPEALETDEALRAWVARGVTTARSLPPR